MRGHQHRIDNLVRHGSMPTLTFYRKINFVGTCHVHSRAKPYLTHFEPRHHMLTYYNFRFWVVECTFLHQQLCTSGQFLFTGLKY